MVTAVGGVGGALADAGIVGAGASLFGASEQADAATSAAQTSADASNQASQLQYKEWQQQQANMQPWLTAGTAGVNALSYGMGLSPTGGATGATGPAGTAGGFLNVPSFSFDPTTVANNPDYKFVTNQGTNALASQAAAGGNYGSGNMGVALENYGQGAAAQYMQQYYNQALGTYNANLNSQYTMPYNFLAGVSGTGQIAAQNLANTGQAAETNIGGYTQAAGNALASGTMGSANAYSGALNNVGANAMSGYGNYLNYTNQQALISALAKNNNYGSPNFNYESYGSYD